ncbi:uncharacterized protein CTHT_0056840 [Thermochaetoides thermophila DSM 1495]|uniref:Restriction of telomere capping protein 4 n=1 Tax=Chaetomium thermophilum (strain DSM 1495 / CBS 144.50 / IMI 039719) TaxID=759272 RepID=G0SCD6_CHATD|nr:hypothetical protein CTHT_0056840 [Thermochaetoides thermophila DSM 1495]EGS19062.1 hypothetical protein CTHT_0056840 [Thermochaetoides thermophila DSM 1495]
MKQVSDDAPPLSSSDLSDSDDGLPRRGDIQPTLFSSNKSRKRPSLSQDEDDEWGSKRMGAASKRPRTAAKSSVPKEPKSGPEIKRKTTETITLSSSPIAPESPKESKEKDKKQDSKDMQDDDLIFSFMKKPKATYGSRNKFTKPATTTCPSTEKTPERKKKPKSTGTGFIRPPSLPPLSDSTPDTGFKRPPDLPGDTPEKPITGFRMPPPLPGMSDDEAGTANANKPSSTDKTTSIDVLSLSGSDSPMTDLSDLFAIPKCPLCQKEVSAELLEAFKKEHSLTTVAAMRNFCEQHNKKSARETWNNKGYPDINWSKLDERIAKYYPVLRDILELRKPSYYREKFSDSIKDGGNKTLLRSDVNLTPGYYGIRGLQHMSENLISKFSGLLRERAVLDKLVSARGTTRFLQSVLVPELAMRLVMEDMNVGEEEARKVLEESSWVGDLLNDEIADVVNVDSDDDKANSEREQQDFSDDGDVDSGSQDD